jgi:hypothetical protein
MELEIFDEELNPIGIVEKITSFIWVSRYRSCGDFKLLAPFTERHADLLKNRRLIMVRGGSEAAEIQYTHIRQNEEGTEEIEVQGKKLPDWLSKRIILSQIASIDTPQSIIVRAVHDNAVMPQDQRRIIPRLDFDYSDYPDGEPIEYMSEPYAQLLLTCTNLAQAAQLGIKITTDVRGRMHFFHVYKGRDLTVDQMDNKRCVFSREYENVLAQEFVSGIENLKTVSYVGGEEVAGAERTVVEVGEQEGLERAEVYINASDITRIYTDENHLVYTLTEDEYIRKLIQRGTSELEGYTETLSFSSKINTQSGLKFGRDFDVGDLVTCIDRRWGVKINVRITEVTETYQQGRKSVDVTFGSGLPTLLEQIRKLR